MTERKSFSDVLIIGNGFDLNLGLKTSYRDFLRSMHFDQLLENENQLCMYLKERHELRQWIDIENELKEYARNSQRAKLIYFQKEFNSLCSALIRFLNLVSYENLNTSAQAYSLLKELRNKKTLIIDFNYTKTVGVIMNLLGMSEGEFLKIHKIHGSLELGQIIFSVEDEADVSNDYIFLLKSCNKHYSSVDIGEILQTASNVHFFGHSLGETDHFYFKTFFSNQTTAQGLRKNITFYYYGDEGWAALHKQLRTLTDRRVSLLKQLNNFTGIDCSKVIYEIPMNSNPLQLDTQVLG